MSDKPWVCWREKWHLMVSDERSDMIATACGAWAWSDVLHSVIVPQEEGWLEWPEVCKRCAKTARKS